MEKKHLGMSGRISADPQQARFAAFACSKLRVFKFLGQMCDYVTLSEK